MSLNPYLTPGSAVSQTWPLPALLGPRSYQDCLHFWLVDENKRNNMLRHRNIIGNSDFHAHTRSLWEHGPPPSGTHCLWLPWRAGGRAECLGQKTKLFTWLFTERVGWLSHKQSDCETGQHSQRSKSFWKEVQHLPSWCSVRQTFLRQKVFSSLKAHVSFIKF